MGTSNGPKLAGQLARLANAVKKMKLAKIFRLKNFFNGSLFRQWIFRSPRIWIRSSHKIYLRCRRGSSWIEFNVVNVSTEGVCLVHLGPAGYVVGVHLHGELILENRTYVTELDVVWTKYSFLGCRFSGDSGGLQAAIREYFRVELLGLKLSPINRKFLKTDHRGEVYWYSDGIDNELYFVVKDADTHGIQIVYFAMSFWGHFLEWSPNHLLGYGIIESRGEPLGLAKYSDVIRVQTDIPSDVNTSAIQIIKLIQNLAPELQEQMIHILEASLTRTPGMQVL